MTELDTRMGRIDKVLTSGAKRFDEMGTHMSEAMSAGVEQAMKAMQSAAKSGAVAARSQAQEALEPLLLELKKMMTGVKKSAEESRGALVEGGRSAASDLGAAVTAAGASLTGASSKISGDITQAFEASTARILAVVEGSVAGYRKAADELAARLQSVERGLETLEGSVRRNAGQLEQAGGAMALAGKSVGSAADQLRQAASPIQASLQAVHGAAEGARDTLQMFQGGAQQMREAHAALVKTSTAAAEAFRSYEARFAGVDESLGKTFGEMRDGFDRIGDAVRDVVGSYDKHLGDAVRVLSGAVSDVTEAVEGLSMKIAEPV
jgi:methyl-accepting chemotaxis protein